MAEVQNEFQKIANTNKQDADELLHHRDDDFLTLLDHKCVDT